MITTAALYLAAGYATMGVAVFIHMLAISMDQEIDGDWQWPTVLLGLTFALVACVIAWPRFVYNRIRAKAIRDSVIRARGQS